MEKIFENNERLKRAEELYLRKNGKESKVINNGNKKKRSFGFYVLLIINIVIISFFIKNKETIFQKEFLDTVNVVNNNLLNSIVGFVNNVISEDSDKNVENEIVENNVITNEINNISIIDENSTIKEIKSSISNQMEDDVKNLKAIYKFVSPLKGEVSSDFGSRTSKFQNVSGYHTGIDIAAKEGTEIVASMEGIVTTVSSQGDYGKHIKIRCNNVTTLYAHCSKIFVKEGQIVGKDQLVALVGNTGNSTGPHLHFEIRIDDRFVDPSKVITF